MVSNLSETWFSTHSIAVSVVTGAVFMVVSYIWHQIAIKKLKNRMAKELLESHQSKANLGKSDRNRKGSVVNGNKREGGAEVKVFSSNENGDGRCNDDNYEAKIERMISRWEGKKSKSPQTHVTKEELDRKRHVSLPACSTSHQKKNSDAGDFVSEDLRTKVVDEADIVIVGGGPAGISAALAAARVESAGKKLDVLIVERFGCFGGVITTVGMETLGWYRYEGCTTDCKGIGAELERVSKRLGASSKWAYNDSECLDTEKFKSIADDLLTSAGVRTLLHTLVVDVVLDGEGAISGIIVENKGGRGCIKAKRTIDCSGDADVSARAGSRFTYLERNDSMGVTSVFNMVNVDKNEFLRHTEKNPATYLDWSKTWQQDTTGKENHLKSPYMQGEFEEENEAKRAGDTVSLGGSWSALSEEGEATNLNLVHMKGIDPLDAYDLTKAEIDGRKGIREAINALKKKVPGFQNAKLRNTAMTLGVRDSRKIVGKYHLTGKDCITQAKFKDSIGIFPEFIDGYNILVFKLVCGRREERNGVREELCKKSHKKVLLLTFDCSADVSWNICGLTGRVPATILYPSLLGGFRSKSVAKKGSSNE